MLTIHITDEKIYSANITKNNKVKNYQSIELQSDIIVNGSILNEEIVTQILSSIVSNYKQREIILTVESTSIIYRELELPKGAVNKLEKTVYYRMQQQINNIQDFVVDYSILSKSTEGKIKLFIAAIPKNIYEQYMNLIKNFKKYNFKITTSTTNLLNRVEKEITNNQSHILVDYTGGTYTTMLFTHGEFVFAINFKQNSSLSPVEKQSALLERISQMVQFQRIKDVNANVEYITLCGDLDDMEGIKNSFRDSLGIDVITFNDSYEFETKNKYYTYSNSMFYSTIKLKKKMINFIHPIKHDDYKKEHQFKKLIRIFLITFIVNLLILSLIFVYLILKESNVNGQIKNIQKEMNAEYTKTYEDSLKTIDSNKKLQLIIDDITKIKDLIDQNKGLNKTVYDQIISIKPATTELLTISVQDGTNIYFSFSTPSRMDSYEYVKKLETIDEFSNVDYSILSYNAEKKLYNFNVVISLKGVN